MRTRTLPAAQAAVLAVTGVAAVAVNSARGTWARPVESPALAADRLRPVAAFASIAQPRARAAALFLEMGRVLQHPRCMNCHPAGDRCRATSIAIARFEFTRCPRSR